jgi:Uma2 family endonuclease
MKAPPTLATPATSAPDVPPLQNGDRLTRIEFERRYEAMPDLKKAELIDGVVYMPSPVTHSRHSAPHFDLITWLGLYRISTPGVRGGDNGTLRLDLDNAPQPDAYLLILPSHGGQARIDDEGYIVGAPELVAEVSASRVSLDLHAKFNLYRRNGVREYVVWRVDDAQIDWFVLREGRLDPLPRRAEGLYQSEVFPGLYLDAAALIGDNMPAVAQAVGQGLASPEHAAFVQRLQSAAASERSANPS